MISVEYYTPTEHIYHHLWIFDQKIIKKVGKLYFQYPSVFQYWNIAINCIFCGVLFNIAYEKAFGGKMLYSLPFHTPL